MHVLWLSMASFYDFFLLAFGTVPTVLVFVFHFIYWLLELFRQCWFLLAILFIGFWNCSDSVGFCFPFFIGFWNCSESVGFCFPFLYWFLELFRQCWFLFSILFIGFWNCSDSVGFCFPFFLLTFGTVPTVLVFVFHFLLVFGTVPTVLVFVFHFFIDFWNCSDSVGFCFPFFY